MRKKQVHTVKNKSGGWDNKLDGGKILSHHLTKEKAQEKGRKVAQSLETEHVIHNKDGKISQKNSYGNDPFPPKDE